MPNYLPQTSIQSFLLPQRPAPQMPPQMRGLLSDADPAILQAGLAAFRNVQPTPPMRPPESQLSPEVAAQPDLPQDPSMLAGLRGQINSMVRQPIQGLRDQGVMAGYDLYNKMMPPQAFGGQMSMPQTGASPSSERQQELMKMILRVVGGGM